MADDIVLGAKQLPNPKNITPKLDTDKPDVPKNSPKMDISNPPNADFLPKATSLPKGARHQLGRHVPITVSEN